MVEILDYSKTYEQGGIDIYYKSGVNPPLRKINEYTGSDQTANGTYTTICDQGGSGVLKSITCSSSNSSAQVALKLTINGVEEVLFDSLNANPLRGHSANESVTWHCDIPYSGGVKVEIDSSNPSYTTYCTVVLHQD